MGRTDRRGEELKRLMETERDGKGWLKKKRNKKDYVLRRRVSDRTIRELHLRGLVAVRRREG